MNAPATNAPQPRRRRGKRLAAALACAALAYALHAPVLRGVWSYLVVDAPLHAADVAVVSASTVDETVDAYRRGLFRRLLVAAPRSSRTSLLGITPSPADELKHLLQVRGVDLADVEFLPSADDRADAWALAEALGRYLAERPQVAVAMIVERQRSRHWTAVFERSFDDALRGRIAVFPAAGRRFDEDRWWIDRLAVQSAAQQYLQLAVCLWHGPRSSSVRRWTVEELEAAVARGDRL